MSTRHRISGASSRHTVFPWLLWPKSVRAKTVALLAVPVVSLMALWALATVSAVQNAWTLHQVKEVNGTLSAPLRSLVNDLQAERAAVAGQLAAQRADGDSAVSIQRGRTAAAATALLDGVVVARADIENLAPEVNWRIDALMQDLDGLRGNAPSIFARQMDWRAAYGAYTAAIEDAFAVDEALAKVQHSQAASAARVVLQLGRVGEMISRQDAIATSALAAGRMTQGQQQAFGDALGGQHVLTSSLLPELPPADQAAYQRLVNDASYRSLATMQDDLLSVGVVNGAVTSFSADQWHGAVRLLMQGVQTSRANASAAAAHQAELTSSSAVTQAALVAILGLVAVLLALVISVLIGRGMVIELVSLRNSALELANRRLPRAMRKLRAGEKIDLAADVPVVAPGDGEVGEVGEALNAVQRSALQAAAERAELLTGVSGVFVNLARRNQSLVHRQLSLLDNMERRNEDPATLEDLFRLDHLATRMRRHAEGLIIMSGATPGRVWRYPVALMDLIRSAVAEVEDFARVEVRRLPELWVGGSAVSDLTHMIAELVENATSFSPPETTVLVHGEAVGTGFVVEIEDRGLGMSPDRMAEANRLIADSHQLELFEGDRLGLFVISRLANRQQISVSLRRSPYGGTTAVVLLPASMLVPSPSHPMEMAEQDQQLDVTTVVSAPSGDTEPSRLALAPRLPAEPAAEARPQVITVTPAKADFSRPVAESGPPWALNTSRRDEPPAAGEQATGGLPRRIRQASLAPGLQAEDARGRGEKDETRRVGAQISPEQARSMMSAFQSGFVRGRSTGTRNSTDT